MARQREDLIGQKFGRLTVISLNEEVSKQKKKSHWNCRCECGNEKVIYGKSLKNGSTTSCGCYQKEKASRKQNDLTGQRFGRLVVISYNEEVSKKKKGSHWNCKCDCGNVTVVWGGSLRKGNTNSCGCYNKEKTKEKWQDEEFRQMRIDKVKEQWQDEEFRQMQREKGSKMFKEQWQDEEFRQMQKELSSKRLKEQWQDEEFRQMKSEQRKRMNEEMWQDEEFRQMKSDKMSGDGNPSWKGGITPIKRHLGGLPVVEQWFDNSKKQVNYTCELTGKVGMVHTHHLKAFSTIVKEAHELHNIQVKPQVKDYTKEELHKLEEYVTSWHKDTSNAVVLCKEVHILFHSLYGQGGNTPEQFKEFKQRYLNGEFEGLI